MLTILINTINYQDGDISVTPIGCPVAEHAQVLMMDDKPCCIHNTEVCAYLQAIDFNTREAKKVILCKGNQ